MMVRSTKLVVALCLVGLLAIPAFANSGGPPYLNSDNQETAKYGVLVIIPVRVTEPLLWSQESQLCTNQINRTSL